MPKIGRCGMKLPIKNLNAKYMVFGLAEALPVGFEASIGYVRIEAHLNPVDHLMPSLLVLDFQACISCTS